MRWVSLVGYPLPWSQIGRDRGPRRQEGPAPLNQMRLLLQAMRWRAGAAAALMIVATVAVLAATAGPLYLDTANDSVLHSTLLANPVASTGITIIPSPTANGGSLVSRAQEALVEARRIGLYRFYHPGKMVLDQGFGVVGAGGIRYGGSLVADPGQCGVLHFLAGHCPGVGEVAITERTATALGARLGTVVTLPGSPSIAVKVVGLVALGNPKQSFWFGEEPNYFDFGPALSCGIGASCLPQLDSFFTAGATISRLSSVQPVDEFVLRIDSVHTTDAAAFNRVFGRFSTYTNQALLAPVSTDLGKETSAAGRQSQLMQSIVLVVDLQLPSQGRVLVDGQPIGTGERSRQRFGVVLQNHGLVSVLTAAENVALPLQARGVSTQDVGRLAQAGLDTVGLHAAADALVQDLSGGQQHRVAVASALAGSPDAVLADEPTSELVAEQRKVIVELLLRQAGEGRILVMASHDPEVVGACARQVTLVDGRHATTVAAAARA